MTTAQLDHLRAIDAHLAKLLAIAEKRTPGEWKHDVPSSDPNRGLVNLRHSNGVIATFATRSGHLNLEFAASCSSNAEAGWKATRAAIADWLSLYNSTEGYADGAPDASPHDKLCNEVASICRINLQHILAAFPLESLKA